MLGKKLGPYEIVAELGEGGMGKVPRFSAPTELFRRSLRAHDVEPDGRSFVTLILAGGGERPLELVTHWTATLPE